MLSAVLGIAFIGQEKSMLCDDKSLSQGLPGGLVRDVEVDEALITAAVECNRNMRLQFPYGYDLKRSWFHWCCGTRMIKISIMYFMRIEGRPLKPSFVCPKCFTHKGPTRAE